MYQRLSVLQLLVLVSVQKDVRVAIVSENPRIVIVRNNSVLCIHFVSFLSERRQKMLKNIGVMMAFVGALMISVCVANTFAGPCGCPKDVKCKEGCEKGKTDPCICKH